MNFSKNDLFLIKVHEKLDFILEDIGFYKDQEYLENPPEYIVGANEEIRAYLRGVFLSQGSIIIVRHRIRRQFWESIFMVILL